MRIEWMMALAIAIGVVGLIQLIKGIVKAKVPTWFWSVVSVASCVVFAFLIGGTEAPPISIGEMIVLALLAIAISQLGYEVIVQGIHALVQGLLNIVSGMPGITGPQGPQGVVGAIGAQGATGPTGPTGAQGAAGTPAP